MPEYESSTYVTKIKNRTSNCGTAFGYSVAFIGIALVLGRIYGGYDIWLTRGFAAIAVLPVAWFVIEAVLYLVAHLLQHEEGTYFFDQRAGWMWTSDRNPEDRSVI